MANKEFAKSVLLNNHFIEPDLVNYDKVKEFHKLIETYAIDIRESWDSFIEDNLYKLYEKEGFTKVLQISRKDFRHFLMWALPKYRQEVLNNETTK